MRYRQLGKSALQVSEIGFGCMSLGRDDKQNKSLIEFAIDGGINFFDTADIYDHGQNEISVGLAIQEHRKNILLASKVGNQWKRDGSGLDWNPTKKHILQAIDKSLERLQTHYLDLYQLHGGTIEDRIDESIEAFEILKGQGKIRYYGISSIRPNVIREYVHRSNMVSVMMQYSLLDRRPEESCLELLNQNQVGVLARGSVAKGLLINKPAENYLDYKKEEVEKMVTALKSIKGGHPGTAQTAIQFVLAQQMVSSAVVGIRNKEQLNDALTAADSPRLPESDLLVLKNTISPSRYQQHR
jgi:aryl-alcohol dehydrogenase-like predicted oxidoreductase